MTEPIFKKGPRIRTVAALARKLKAGKWIYLRDKAYHPGWVRCMQFHALDWLIVQGKARQAIRK